MKKQFLLFAGFLVGMSVFAQQFEQPKIDASKFEKINVRLGGDFALQFQGLNHEADENVIKLINLGSNLNLPTANMVIEADLAPGMRVNLTTYLSSRHHNETWVKGGYLLIDKLPFLPASDKIMEYVTIKAGAMQPNVGDQLYRRSDNGNIINNVFVGNYIMDDMTISTGVEVMFRHNGILAMVGTNSGNLKPALGGTSKDETTGDLVYDEYNLTNELAYVWKLAYDKQINDDLRVRAALSGFSCAESHSVTFHSGDRTGSRYYFVMNKQATDGSDFDVTKNFMSGNFYPASGISDNTIVANIFAQYKGFEIFGTYEKATGDVKKTTTTAPYYSIVPYDFTQLAIEGVYRFGKQKQWQLGARYNTVKDDKAPADSRIEAGKDYSVDRIQLAAGWYMTKNIITKFEYVKQNYDNWATYGKDAGFDGFMIEAGISF
ncbi:MAG: hypothetical protein QM786_10945 [Breznakibacter sp.]